MVLGGPMLVSGLCIAKLIGDASSSARDGSAQLYAATLAQISCFQIRKAFARARR